MTAADQDDDIAAVFAKIQANATSERARQNGEVKHEPATQPVQLVDIKTAARIITHKRQKEIGRNTLYKLLRDQGVLCTGNVPKVMYCPRFFKPLLTSYETADMEHYIYKTLVTAEGIALICEMLDYADTQPPTTGESQCH